MKRSLFLTIPILPLLAGCTVGPNYTPPVATAPENWVEPDSALATASSPVIRDWWSSFNDPVLNGLVERAIAENHDLRIAAARVREAMAQRGVAASEFGPRVDGVGSGSRSRSSENFGRIFDDPETNDFQAGFDMSWELDFWGRIRRSVESADADIGAAVSDRDAVMVTLLGEVGRNYAELRGFQQRRLVTINNIQSQKSALDLTQKRFDAGLTTELDVQQALTQLSTTRSNLPTLEAGARRAIYRLSLLVGREPAALLPELTTEAPIPGISQPAALGMPSDLLRRRPDIAAAERRLASATARIGVATADFFPRFDLAGALGLRSDRIGDWFESDSRYWSIGPGFRWPILDWGRIRSNVRVQDARSERALIEWEQSVLKALEETESALTDYTSENARATALQEAVDASRRAVALAEQQYQSGLRDFLNVLTTQRAQFEAEDQLVASRQRVATNLVAVYKALGGGWEPVPSDTAQAK
ncbi:MAG: efflux transporter outer membrane subunit [Phycisphaerales bacterium]